MEPNSPSNQESGPVGSEEARADQPLGFKQHADGDFHLIGETLAEPTVIKSVGESNYLGTSPYVAREDHVHAFAIGTGGGGGIDISAYPVITFGPDDTLVFNDGANQYVFNHDGNAALIIGPNAVYFKDGSRAAPGISYINDTGTGFYRSATGRIGMSAAGGGSLEFGTWPPDPSWHSAITGNNGYLLLGNPATSETYLRGIGGLHIGGFGADAINFDDGTITINQNAYGYGFINVYDYIHSRSGGLSTGGALNVTGNATVGGKIYTSASTSIGGWSGYGNFSAVEGAHGYILLGANDGQNDGCYVRGNADMSIGGWGADCITITSGPIITMNNWVAFVSPRVIASGIHAAFDGLGILCQIGSKESLKENIATFTDSGPIIDALRPVTFRASPPTDGTVETEEATALREEVYYHGFIAEEVDLVEKKLGQYEYTYDELGARTDTPIMWDSLGMISVLVAEVKALRQRVEALEARVGPE